MYDYSTKFGADFANAPADVKSYLTEHEATSTLPIDLKDGAFCSSVSTNCSCYGSTSKPYMDGKVLKCATSVRNGTKSFFGVTIPNVVTAVDGPLCTGSLKGGQ